MKSMDFGKTWIPFQYYSSDCKAVYNRNLKAKITQANEQEALCSDAHLNSMNTNRIGFSILEGRPSFHEFDTSPILQDWVTATDIKIVINRLAAPKIQYDDLMDMQNQSRRLTDSIRSLYESTNNYAALSEISIGGRCKCNGHASKCIMGR
jgi:netrin 1